MNSRRILHKAVLQLAARGIVLQVQRAFSQFDILAAFGCKLGQTDLLIHSVDRHLHAGLVFHRDRQAAGVGGLAAFRDFGIFRHQTTVVLTQIDTGLVHDVHGYRHGIGRGVTVGIVHLERKVLGILHSGIRRERERLAFHVHHHLAGLRRQLPLPGLGILGHLLAVQRQITFAVRTEVDVHLAGDRIAFLHILGRYLRTDARHVVGNDHGHHAGTRGTVGIRHRHHQVVGDAVLPVFAVFLRGLRKMIGIVQSAGGGIEARHFQIAFVRGHGVARESAVKNQHAADDDGGDAVLGVDDHGAGGRGAAPAAKIAFLHLQHVALGAGRSAAVMRVVGIVDDGNVAKVAGIDGREGHVIVDVRPCGRAFRIGIHIAARPAHVQTAQTIQTSQKVGIHIFMKTVAVSALSRISGRTCGRHEIRLVHGHEEVFTRDLGAVHLEGRHIILGIGGVKVLKADGGAIFKAQQQIVAVAGQRGFAGGEIKDEMPFRRAGNVLCSIGSRLGKAYVGHITLL